MDGFNFNNTGYAQNQTDRAYNYAPPVYAPFQNPNNVDNAFGYLANMYGPALVQGMAGNDAFLAHQRPGQALADQFTASRYQQSGVRSLTAANTAGNSQVANRLLGVQSLMNGGQPITRLDREHAQAGAQVLNNPVFKAFAASQIGAENLEDVMFGRRGDPGAIASATNRVGFFRGDAATGDRRMSGKSLEGFSQSLYQNLYGPDANLDEMHGFNATASGAMMEDLFQRGKLPQSLGNMTAAERVKAISSRQRDDKTMQRMAENFGHSDLMERDYDYANATAEEQKIMLADKVGGYKDRLRGTFQEIDKFKAADPRAKSAEEITQLEGFGSAANAIDAQRTSKAIKEYNGALAAIREIFGDSGRTGAPVQELMASLQQLTSGSQGGLSQGKVESLVREMRIAARDTNTDVGALTTMMQEDRAMGQMLGLEDTTVEQGMAGRMLHGQAMADAGAFTQGGFGKLQKAEAEKRSRALSIRADASSGGRSLAALRRIYEENPEKYKGTKLESAVNAYTANQTEFTHNGEQINLSELLGREGVGGVLNLARESGADNSRIHSAMTDRKGTEQYVNKGYAMEAQGARLQSNLSRPMRGELQKRLNDDAFKKLRPAGMSEEDFRKQSVALAADFSYGMAGVVLKETDDMTVEQRNAHVEKRGKEELTKYFRSAHGGNLGEKAAEREAEKYFNAFYGDTAAERTERLNTSYAQMNRVSMDRTGKALAANQQLYDPGAQQMTKAQKNMLPRRADRLKDASAGTESTLLQRASDELDNLGSGNAGLASEAIERVFNVVSEDSILQKYAPDMQEGLVAVAKLDRAATTTVKDINKLVAQAEKEPDGAAAKTLKQMAGFKPDQKLTEEEQASLGSRALMSAGEKAKGVTSAERAANEAQRQRATTMFKAFNTGRQEDVIAGAQALAKESLGADTNKKKLDEFAQSALNTDTTEFEKRMRASGLSADTQTQARNVARALRASSAMGGLSAAGLSQTTQSVDTAQERSVAKANEVTRAVRDHITKQVEKGLDQPAFDKLQPNNQPADVRNNQRKEFARNASETLAGITVNEMGGAENMSPEERAEYMRRRTTEEFTKHFQRKGMVPARASEQAKKHFEAAFGSDTETVTRRMNAVYDTTIEEAKARGNDTALANSPLPTEVDPTTGKTKYDHEKLGVTKTLSAEQQKLVEEVGRDPSGAGLSDAINDKKKRELLLTIPDAAAVDLFGKFTPEAQQKGLDNIDALRNSAIGQMAYRLTGKDTQNLSRIRDAIGDKAPAGLSSQNVNQPISTRQLQAAAIDQEMATLYNTKARGGWFTSEKTFSDDKDKAQYRDLSQRRMELETVNPAAFVDSQIAEVQSRAQSGWFTSEKSLSDEDQEQLDFLTKRRGALTGIDAVQAGRESISAAGGITSMAGDPASGFNSSNYRSPATGDGGTGGGQGNREMNLSGTLTLNGLSEAILQASGRRMEETPDGGAPIDLGRGGGSYNGR